MSRPLVNPGKIDWSGENPGIDLKDETGRISAQITFFRVCYSGYGPGHVAVFLTDPQQPHQMDGRVNAVYTDNPPLAQYLVANFVRTFDQYQHVPGLLDLPVKRATGFTKVGDSNTAYSEVATTEDGELRLSWSRLRDPFLIEVPAHESPTRQHEIFSLFVPGDNAEASVGSVHASGKVFPSSVGGRESSSAFLAFSETWIRPR
jgi:hypothetical protein